MDVLVPIDDPATTHEAVEYAIREYPDASITVLHVMRTNTVYPAGMGGAYMHGSAIDSQKNYAETLFGTAIETADANGGSVATSTAVGSPVREIVKFAAESDTDHIVIGSCDRSGLSRLLRGNVTEGVVRRAAVPVTVLK